MDDLVSIVVTSYNHAEFLQQRMESLLSQTYENTEIIVVDDCSTDGSQEILDEFKSNKKVRLYLLNSNKGYVHVSNFGVSKAKGDYIVFAECDDFSELDQIESLHKAIKNRLSVGVVWSQSFVTNEKGNVVDDDLRERDSAFKRYCQTDVQIPGSLLLKFMLHSNVIPNMSAAIFRKSLFIRIGGLTEKYKLSADYDLWVRMAEVSDFYYLKSPLNNYRTHPYSVRKKLGTAVQLIEMLDVISYIKGKILLTFKEHLALNMYLGKRWFHFAKYEFNLFRTTFFAVFVEALRKEPQILIFMILNIPVLSIQKIGRSINSGK
ncbi:MAG: glycosyltransferase [Prolixibacteraceae bacterium]